jgi:hypothetical protein
MEENSICPVHRKLFSFFNTEDFFLLIWYRCRQNGAYGTAILVLPSNFKGGDTFAEYHGEEILFHNDRTSAEGAYYMAWYNDVDIKSEPVMTGYRIAIVFSLIHDIETAAENASIIKYLQEKRVLMSKGLLSAKEEQKSKIYLERATEYLESQKAKMKYPIVYMLDYNYTSPSLTVNQLKCSDKIIARFLETVAEKAGYLCFLGSVEREVEGKVNESNNLVTTESTNKNDDCPIDEEGIYLTQCSLYDDYILTRLIDSSGKNILEKPVGLDSKNQPVIIQGVSWYARCKPDSEDFSGTVNVKEVTVKYWYSNTSVSGQKKTVESKALANRCLCRLSLSSLKRIYLLSLKCLNYLIIKGKQPVFIYDTLISCLEIPSNKYLYI